MTITNDIRYIGVDDHKLDLFEGQYDVPLGMAYNSYFIDDAKIAIMDTVDVKFTHEWLDNLAKELGDRKPDYLIVQHMEPDHSANIMNFLKVYPETTVVATAKAFVMMEQFFDVDEKMKRLEVANGDTLNLGKHELTFVFAPMVHWPEVMVTYDATDKVLFSADAFGKFGANDVEDPEGWACEARRYYFGIVGKYGAQAHKLLDATAGLDIQIICPLHGPVLSENLEYYLDLYEKWTSYTPETEGVFIAYTSVYGHTKDAVEFLEKQLKDKGCPRVVVADLAREDIHECVEDAFRHSKVVFASTTYNAGVFPIMHHFIELLAERNFQKRTIGFIENGSWAPQAKKTMKSLLEGNCKNLTCLKNEVTIMGSMKAEQREAIEKMAEELCVDYVAQSSDKADKNDLSALYRIGYGLYVITSNDGNRDNGMICNTVTQLTSKPNRIAVNINKENYSHHVIKQTGKMNVNCLSVDAPFAVFKQFGFQSGRTVDKFEGEEVLRSDNGLVILPQFINAVMSLEVKDYIDLDTHGMFICEVTEARVMSNRDTMTYSYYQQNVKPRPETDGKKGWVCTVCGYVYEGDPLPDDFICPLCKHGAADFERIG